jgi:hypothetical protein
MRAYEALEASVAQAGLEERRTALELVFERNDARLQRHYRHMDRIRSSRGHVTGIT